jgi:hypothetical protein
MKKYKKIIAALFLIILIDNINLHAQNFIAAKTFVKDNTVYLRWIPGNISTLNSCNEKGYTIKRIRWNLNTLPDSSNFRSASILFKIKSTEKENNYWTELIKIKVEAGFLYNVLYEAKNNSMDNDMTYGLAMISCDFDIELAKAAGLFYKDENLSQGKYAYLIQPTDNKINRNIKPAIVLVNNLINDELQNIDSLKIITRRKEVKLVWNAEQLKNDYTGYFIERSDDGEIFSQLNGKPHIQIQTQYEKEKKNISYNDTITKYGKTYYYRIRGLGFFGMAGNYSNIVKCKLVKPLDVFPQADSTHLVYDSTLQLSWHMPENFNLNELQGFNIYRCKNIEGDYKKINQQLLSKETIQYIDYFPNQSNYYKVFAYNTSSDSICSHPMMGLVPDIHPPKTPIGLKGEIDSLGNIALSWLPNKEDDLTGYRVFRKNASNEELVEITKEIVNDTVYRDTITLQTLTEDVFYSITAVDKVYNNSPFTSAIKIKRPDKIKPVEAQFINIIHNDSSIIVKWIPSTSKDVKQYELWRNMENSPPEKIKEWAATDTLYEFIDRKSEYGKFYQYQIKVIDDDNNFSVSNSAPHYFDSRIRKQIKKINYKIDLENKSITLNWSYPEKELYSFNIYKAKKGEPLKIIKTLNGDILTFDDKDLSIGNEYEYRIKANFISGAESYISDAIVVEF